MRVCTVNPLRTSLSEVPKRVDETICLVFLVIASIKQSIVAANKISWKLRNIYYKLSDAEDDVNKKSGTAA